MRLNRLYICTRTYTHNWDLSSPKVWFSEVVCRTRSILLGLCILYILCFLCFMSYRIPTTCARFRLPCSPFTPLQLPHPLWPLTCEPANQTLTLNGWSDQMPDTVLAAGVHSYLLPSCLMYLNTCASRVQRLLSHFWVILAISFFLRFPTWWNSLCEL